LNFDAGEPGGGPPPGAVGGVEGGLVGALLMSLILLCASSGDGSIPPQATELR
jgi:hypothetical protein